jgi:hypothetical protein
MGCQPLLRACTLVLALFVFTSILPSAAQSTGFAPGEFHLLFVAVQAKGASAPISTRTAAALGLPVAAPLPSRQVDLILGSKRHVIESFVCGSHSFVALTEISSDEGWGFLVDETGTLRLAFHGFAGHRTLPISTDESQPLAAREEAFWMQWLAAADSPLFSSAH